MELHSDMCRKTLSVNLAFLSNGKLDIAATEKQFETQLNKYRSTHDGLTMRIAKAVQASLETKDKPTLMPLVIHETMNQLTVSNENFNTILNQVHDYIQSNSQGDKALFKITRGKGGGVSLNKKPAVPQTKTPATKVTQTKTIAATKGEFNRNGAIQAQMNSNDEKILAAVRNNPGSSGNAIGIIAGIAGRQDAPLQRLLAAKKIRFVKMGARLKQWFPV